MSKETEVLENYYNSFINQSDDYGFFYGLASYLNYILETPFLKKIVDEVMEKKQEEYDKLAKLEEISLQELTQAKKKLLKIIKDNAIPPNSLTFRRFVSPTEGAYNILTELELFEEGKKLRISGFKSDNFETFLYDIASNLLNLGHKSLLKELLILDKTNNKNSNFIFSKTLKQRRNQSEFIEKTEKFELWGVLNKLLKFQKAFLEKSKNNDYENISQKYCGIGRNWQEGKDAVDIIFLAQELDVIIGGNKNQVHSVIQKLKRDNFKTYAMTINAYIIKELSRSESTEALKSLGNPFIRETEKQRRQTIIKGFQREIDIVDNFVAEFKKQQFINPQIKQYTQSKVIEKMADEEEKERKMEEGRKWELERALKEKQHKELLKQNRILATKETKYIHAIDLIIEQVEFHGSESSFSIDYYYFNFENRMDASKMLEKFLLELQTYGCFENYNRVNSGIGVRFTFTKASIDKLRKFKESFEKKKDQKDIRVIDSKKIEKITIIKMNNGKKLIAVNDIIQETKEIKSSSKWWQIFVKEIEERDMTNKTNEKGIPEDMKSCFNYNIKKSPLLYRGGQYALTDIFTGSGIDTIINPDIKTEIITEKQYKTRKSRKVKK